MESLFRSAYSFALFTSASICGLSAGTFSLSTFQRMSQLTPKCCRNTLSDFMPPGLFVDERLDVRAQVAAGNQIYLFPEQFLEVGSQIHEIVECRLSKLDQEINITSSFLFS